MTKIYIRYCDGCKKQITNMYDYGVTTLFKRIRIGRGHSFHDYEENSIMNEVSEKTPNDYDTYGTKWDNDGEFSFCSPECLLNFLTITYIDTYNDSLKKIKIEKEKTLDTSFEEFKKKNGAIIPFFKKIQTTFSKKTFKENAIKEADKLIADIKNIKKKIK